MTFVSPNQPVLIRLIDWTRKQTEIIEPGIESCDQQFATVKAVLIGNGFAFVAARLCTMIICINYGWDVDSSLPGLFVLECKAPMGKLSSQQNTFMLERCRQNGKKL